MFSQQKSRGCQQRSRGCTARTSPLNLNYLCPMSWLSMPPDHLDPGTILVKRSERCGTHLNPTTPHKHPWQQLMNGSVDQGKHPLNSSIQIMYRNHSNNVNVIYHCWSRIWFFYLSLVLKLFNICQSFVEPILPLPATSPLHPPGAGNIDAVTWSVAASACDRGTMEFTQIQNGVKWKKHL